MPVDHRERTFEAAIEDSLLIDGGYVKAAPTGFDHARCLDPVPLLAFVQETQPTAWGQIAAFYGARAEAALLDDLTRALDGRGSLDVLRHGFKCLGRLVQIAAFKPATTMNPEAAARYAANRLTVTRQLRYSTGNDNSLDLVLSVNGIPVVTAELKNPLSGQNFSHAQKQYREDRDPREPIFQFKKRALVHFAVDTDTAWMTTRLAGASTRFLPFNRGDRNGAGNEENPRGYKTAYLWEEVWARDSLLDILGRFLHVETTERTVDGRRVRVEALIFPRYHQLDVVRRLEADAGRNGAGQNYLVQHSAGSGKSNSIAWVAHRLASLHDARDGKVFDSVVVVTDRRVLDQQLQQTIYQFEHRQGVVLRIDEDSAQLAGAIEAGVPIIITTLQKFPFVADKVASLPKRRYAVIVDEAHSSQSGEAAMELKAVLAGPQIHERAATYAVEQGLPDHEEEIVTAMLTRGRQENISFFAFTATPKARTLEVFGTPDDDGTPRPFHLYSMRQAIEERFILDVLKHYTTYTTYFRLVKHAEDDPQVEKKPAAKALARFLSFHPYNLAQKTEVMIEHFQTFARHKIGAKAKAMVVAGSRLHAVRYKQAFDAYLGERRNDRRYAGISTLVAFSGTVIDPDTADEYTEPSMNGIPERQLPERFAGDDYQLLIVAEKYQTGFDQPLLHTMYVDTRLDGVRAVQTLSRLNRTHPGKDDTFVLDFVNDAETIREAFQPYYERTEVSERAEPQQLYQLQADLNDRQVYHLDEVDACARVFFTGNEVRTPAEEGWLQAQVNRYLDPAVTRFGDLDPADAEAFRGQLTAFRTLYSFLSQVIPYQDSDLEKLYVFARFLLPKLPRRAAEAYRFDDDVSLKYYRLEKISEGEIGLRAGENGTVAGPVAVGTGAANDERVELSRLVDLINDRFGTQFTLADELFFEQVREEAAADETLQVAAHANSLENFRHVFDGALQGIFVDRMEQNYELFAKLMGDQSLKDLVTQRLRQDVYERILGGSDSDPSAGAVVESP